MIKKILPLLFITLVAILIFPPPAPTQYFPTAIIDYYSREYGILVPDTNDQVKVGSTVDAMVTDAEKLVLKGYRGISNGDQVKLTFLGNARWKVKFVSTGQEITIKVPIKMP